MSLPPVTVHIKRKATDEPVDFLRVHESSGKRQRRASEFVFSRQPQPDSTSPALPPAVRRIKQLPRSESSPSLGQNTGSSTAGVSGSQDAPLSASEAIQPISQAEQIRRFHISRSANSLLSQKSGSISKGTKRNIESQPIVFSERKARSPSSQNAAAAGSTLPSATTPSTPSSRPLKKPGMSARTPTRRDNPASPAHAFPARQVRMPSGRTIPWDVNSEQLAKEMQAFTLAEIGRTLAESEQDSTPSSNSYVSPRRNGPPSRFKPKKPLGQLSLGIPKQDAPDMDVDMAEPDIYEEDLEDDSEYIIDTYVRIAAHDFQGHSEKNVGLLVLDSQPDIDEFYRDGEEADEVEDEDDEDENAEDHYTADYPEDEVESDDEYGQNTYQYRNHNASDNEEYDLDDPVLSDDDATRYPWSKPVQKKTTMIDSDDDD